MSVHEPDEKFTDLGNAKRLVARHGDDIRYVPAWGCWLEWDGRRWCRDETGAVMCRAKGTIRSLDSEVARLNHHEQRKSLRTHINRSEHVARLEAMVRLASTERGIALRPEQLDADPNLLNCLNRTIDLRNGAMREHRREDLITKLAPVHYDSGARSELWDDFLSSAAGGDQELALFLQRAAGYTAFGINSEEVFFVILGGTATGKSTFVEALKAALGDYAMTADFETFLRRNQSDGPRNDLARLRGARLVTAGEVAPGRQLDETTVKALTGGDTIAARFLHREFFEFTPQMTIWLHANHRPAVRDDDPAIWRRIRVVPFESEVPKEKRDPSVKARLKDPKDGGPAVLLWIIAGAQAWREGGLGESRAVRTATAAYQAEMATFAEFIEDKCVEAPEQWVGSARLMTAYQSWSTQQGFRLPYGPKRIKDVLRGRGHSPQKRGGVRGWQGIGLIGPAA